MNSKNKGTVGERELSGILREYGYNTRRGQQCSGVNGDADVVGLPGIHIECKRKERLNISDAMAKSIRDAKPGEMPTVFHRKNCEPWKVTTLLDDWLKLYGNQRQEWIWCRDRMPEEPLDNARNVEQMKEYIVLEKGVKCATCVFYAGNGKWYADRTYCDVVAWMPMPAPPEEYHE